jgi:hypothetical protein
MRKKGRMEKGGNRGKGKKKSRLEENCLFEFPLGLFPNP